LNVLITGGTGALGRAVIAQLQTTDGCTIRTAGRQRVIDSLRHYNCDLAQPASLRSVLDTVKPDLVLHLAATLSADFATAYAVNVASAKAMLDWASDNKTRTRIVLIGSAAEYGKVESHDNPVKEAQVLAPVSLYGMTKAWQSQLLGLYQHQGVDVVCARIFNLTGPGVSTALFAGRIAEQIQQVRDGKRTRIETGSLATTRDYLGTAAAASMVLVIARHGLSGEVYHVASGIPITMRELLLQQLARAGLPAGLISEADGFSNHKGYNVPVIYADMTKTRNLPGIDSIDVTADVTA
jgi:GDP-4-dehydro-6-deoxy-D-mannose reductase